MWYKIADLILKNKILLLVLILASTVFFGYKTSQVKMSYTFTNAIPTDNPKYQDYKKFIETYGNDGNTIMLGITTPDFFQEKLFNQYVKLTDRINAIDDVIGVLSINKAVYFKPDSVNKLGVASLFGLPAGQSYTQLAIDSIAEKFKSLPIYRGLLYNEATNTYLMAINIGKDVMKSNKRKQVINKIIAVGDTFAKQNNLEVHYSGLPFIRTQTANLIQGEITIFLVLSFVLTAIIIFLFFRTLSAVLISLTIIGIGVLWAMGMLPIFGYEITTLTGCIPPLMVVIAIPNCIYILNSYHHEYTIHRNKEIALRNMIGKMGIITLFTNVTTAIGFGVFAFTKSIILKEFGLITGINCMTLFVITLVVVPIILSYLPAPDPKHTNYLESKWINGLLNKFSKLVVNNRMAIYLFSGIVATISILGIMRLKSVGFIVDDLPKSDKVVSDLKFFEKNFKGVMPLEIIIDTKEKYGALKSLALWEQVDSLNNLLTAMPEIGGGLNLIKAVKFAKQGMNNGAEESYALPNSMEFSAIRPNLISAVRKQQKDVQDTATSHAQNPLLSVLRSYIDSNAQSIRLSVNIADVGSKRMPELLAVIEPQARAIFADSDVELTFTGTSITFLEGSKFIINSLGESLAWALGMIIVCMFILFRSIRMVGIAMISNLIPIALTAGIMGWLGIPLKPSTVLVFSIAMGITVDVTIRFMTTIQQKMKEGLNLYDTVLSTIRETGLSIICTTAILVFGFGVFAVSQFDGTKALGYLTALTLFLAMIFNLTLQPALLLWMDKSQKKKSKAIEK